MTDTKGTEGEAGQAGKNGGKETVGDIIRRERVTRRITVETVAKELKLNAGYIKALEANNYDLLPADPYVRVYLRSIAGYLMLDSDQILRKFYEDRGLKPALYKDERSTKLTITMKEPTKRGTPWIMIITVVIIIAALSYVANKYGWISTSMRENAAVKPAQPDTAVGNADETGLIDSMAMLQDSMGSLTARAGDTVKPSEAQQAAAGTIPPADSLRIEISASRDSLWLQLFSDGVSWRSYIYAGRPRGFAAADSFNMHIGHTMLCKIMLNGKPLQVNEKGVRFYKLDRTGLAPWTQSKWNKVFKDRLK